MKQTQINHKEMHETVISYLDDNTEKWSAIPKVAEFKNAFSTVAAQIDEVQEAQQAAQVFLGKNKKQIKKDVAFKGDVLNDGIEAFALVTGDNKLRNKMEASFSDLYRLRNADFIPAIKEIIAAYEANSETLQNEYGVTVEQVDDLKASFDDFLAINGQPRAYKIASVQATKSLDQLFDDASDILENKLDKVMSIFKRRDVGFYNGYLAARVIVDN